jgi:predicted tellurium resistance membrane protein TerC
MFISVESLVGSAIMLFLLLPVMVKLTDFLEQYNIIYTVLLFICLFTGLITIGLTAEKHVHFNINTFLVCLFTFFFVFVRIFCRKRKD